MSKIEVPADSMSGEGPVPGSETAIFLLYLHTVEGVRELFCSVYTISFMRAPLS